MTALAVRGVGAVTPLGATVGELMAGLDAGRSGLVEAGELEAFPELGGRLSRWAGRVRELDTSPYIHPRQARRLDRGSLFALAAARQALSSAGLAGDVALEHGLGLVAGTTSAGSGPLTVFLEALSRQGPEAAPPFEFPNTVANAPAGHVSIQLGLKGPNVTLAHGESSVGQGVVYGRLLLEAGRCQRLLVGAVDEWSPYYQVGYSQLGALRRTPAGGGGTLLNEGAAFALLEPQRDAPGEAAAGEALCRLTGAAVASCTGEPYRWLADADTLVRAVEGALSDADRAPAEVGSVVLAANGVDAMEEAEAAALERLFAGRGLAASGVKGALGERAVSGAVSLVVAALARRRGVLPPYAGGARQRWPAAVEPLAAPAPLPPGATLVLLYGSGGNYAALLLE